VSRLDPAAEAVAAQATSAQTWAQLTDLVLRCTTCAELAAARQTVVVGEFRPGTSLLLVGEAPGAAEDATGRPFVGKAGQLLDELLLAAGLDRSRVSVANVLKCRPPGNRAPSRLEMGRCRGWLDRQIELMDPALVVTLGGTAATWAFGRPVRLADVRGRTHPLPSRPERLVLPTYHPSAAIRFGPSGEPRRLLASDLALAASLVAERS
jgi:uracil-DNA glycosylase family 4